MEPRRRSMTGRFALVAGLAAIVASGGCASPAPAEREPLRGAAIDGGGRGPAAPDATDPPSLADRARLDVEAILAHRAAVTPPVTPPAGDVPPRPEVDAPAETRATAAVEPPASPVATVPRIEWMRPRGAPAAPAPPAAGEAGAAPPLARPTDAPPTVVPPAGSPAQGGAGADRIGEMLVNLSGELYRESAYADQPLRELLAIAAGSLVRPERGLNAEAFRTLTAREQEILARFQEFFERLGSDLDGAHDSEAVIAEAVAALRSALVEEPRLTVTDTALCYHVGGFGDYERFDRNSFLAHEAQQVILYLGLEDFESKRNEKEQWVTHLSQQLVIYSDSGGIPVWTDDWQPAVDVSRNRRQDFFTVQVITLPKALSVGRYQLKIRVRDEHSGAETETAIPFEMVADRKLAARVP